MPSSIDTSKREIVITRIISAPRAKVWKVWTEPVHLEKWWGPTGFTITTKEIDVRTGGEWRFVMHGPDGTDYPNNIVFTEIVEPQRICHDHGSDDGTVAFQAVITFEDLGDKTKLTMRSIFPTEEERMRVIKEHGAIEGGNQTIDKLEAHLLTL